MLAPAPRPDLVAVPDDLDDDELLDAYSVAVSTAAERLIPSVASLRVTRQVGGWTAGGAGSAVAIEPVGYLLTSAHVVAGAERGTATFVDGAELPFEVVGRDPLSDLAVIRTTGGEPPPAPLGDAARLQVGQLVVAIGNPLGFAGHGHGRRRLRARTVARDARRPDESPGRERHPDRCRAQPRQLGRRAGRLARSRRRHQHRGRRASVSGLPCPIDAATRGIIEIPDRQRPRPSRVPRHRRRHADASRTRRGTHRPDRAASRSSSCSSPARRPAAGLRVGDIVLELDGHPIEGVGDLQRRLGGDVIGRSVDLRVDRGGESRSVAVSPVELAE